MRRHFKPYEKHEEEAILAQAKKGLRSRMRALRGAIPEASRQQRSEALVARVRELERYASARTIAAFMAIHGEVDLTSLRRAAAAEGKTVALPRVDLASGDLLLHDAPEEELEMGAYGIEEPREGARLVDPETVDLVLVPALVVDLDGYRVGYGKGYYDRLLPRAPRALACAVVFDFQLVAEVPREAQDVPVDQVITDLQSVMTGAPPR